MFCLKVALIKKGLRHFETRINDKELMFESSPD